MVRKPLGALWEEKRACVEADRRLQPFARAGPSASSRGECGMAVHHGLALHVLWWNALHAGHADGRDTGLLPCLAVPGPELACSN